MEYLNEAGVIGVFAIFALMVIKSILDAKSTRAWRNGNGGAERRAAAPCPLSQTIATQVDAIHGLHTVKDADGVTPLARVSQESRKQTELLEEIRDGIGTISEEIDTYVVNGGRE